MSLWRPGGVRLTGGRQREASGSPGRRTWYSFGGPRRSGASLISGNLAPISVVSAGTEPRSSAVEWRLGLHARGSGAESALRSRSRFPARRPLARITVGLAVARRLAVSGLLNQRSRGG